MSGNTLVLIVEDSDTQALKLRMLLEREDISVHRTGTAEEALEYLRANTPNLVIVDYHLPGMPGDALCRALRQNPGTDGLLLLMLTSDTDQESETQGLESGADDYLRKSTHSDVLIARVQALLAKRKVEVPSTIQQTRFFEAQRILIVEDSHTQLLRLEQQLKREGYSVKAVSSGQEAIEAMNWEVFDCVVLDLVMPGMDGIEVCKRMDKLRTTGRLAFPILMVTNNDGKENMIKAFEAGADDFVSKSAEPVVLNARIRSLLRRKLLHDDHERIVSEFKRKEVELIHERTEKEAALERAALVEQLEKKNKELQEAQVQLVHTAKMASLGELVAGVAHEVNNPLAFSLSHVSTIGSAVDAIDHDSDSHLSEKSRKKLEKAGTRVADVMEGLNRVCEIVEKLKNFSRLDRGVFQSADVRECIESTLSLLSHRLGQDYQVETSFAEDNELYCAPGTLNQVIMTLIKNALDALGESGTIRISTARTDREFSITVSDTGPGVPKEIRDRIFEPFFTTKDVGSGTGLGLAIAYKIAEQHKGRIELRDAVGGGAEFALIVPTNLKTTAAAEDDEDVAAVYA